MNIASLFNYFEAFVWFVIAWVVFLRRKNPNAELEKLAVLVSVSFAVFGFSDMVEASTGAWWRPLWLLGIKALCVLSFLCCWIKYRRMIHKTKKR